MATIREEADGRTSRGLVTASLPHRRGLHETQHERPGKGQVREPEGQDQGGRRNHHRAAQAGGGREEPEGRRKGSGKARPGQEGSREVETAVAARDRGGDAPGSTLWRVVAEAL